ncbi:MAG: hypothetical protein R3194_08310 [Limnobacter sp.]|nr:hypothetical protein [Limnobacter sp.]
MVEVLPWLARVLDQLKEQARANTAPVLLSGPDPKALFQTVEVMLADLLCEQPVKAKACGQCASCHLRQSRNHPDVQYVMPQKVALDLGFLVDVKSGKKPSESILIDDVRQMHGFFNTASTRGAERFAVIFPFEALNVASANALLKSLEEPPNGLRFVLVGHKTDFLLPTIRSRCQAITASSPGFDERVHWLEGQGVEQADVQLSLAMLDPFEALNLSQNQKDVLELRKKWVLWLASPEQQHQLPSGLEKLGAPVFYELALRVCNDLNRLVTGLAPAQFPWLKPRLMWANKINLQAVADVYFVLEQESRHAHHPLNPRLALEFVAQKWQTLTQ